MKDPRVDAYINKQSPAYARPILTRLRAPAYFMAAVKKHKKALANFQGFSPSHTREYVEWVTEAKGDDTRQRRLTQAVAWIAAGKSRNWKYTKP